MKSYLLPVALLLSSSAQAIRIKDIVEDMGIDDFSNDDKAVQMYSTAVSGGKKFTNLETKDMSGVKDPSDNPFFMALNLDEEKRDA